MELNWTLEVFLSILSVVLTLFASVLIYQQNRRNPDRALIVMSIAYLSLSLYFLFSGLGYLLLDPEISMVKNVFLVIISLSITMTISQMMEGSFLNYRLVVISFFSAFALVPYLFPTDESITLMQFDNGAKSLQNIGFNRIILALLFLYVIIILLYFSFKIYRSAPISLRRDASLYFGGNLVIILGAVSFITGVSTIVPGIVELLVSAGILISSYGLIRAPQILYVLPFNAIKLSIIKSDSGISFYNYYWKGDLDDTADQLFGAAFMAITNFMQESIGEGSIQEVKLEGATITISKPENQAFYYVVIATKPSYVLKKGLEQFVRSFDELYGDILSNQNYVAQEFKEADELIPICFPYIPEDN